MSLGALHTALKRMEDKGYLKSYPGEATEDRAGRPKRYFEITAMGKKAMAARERNARSTLESHSENSHAGKHCQTFAFRSMNSAPRPPQFFLRFFRWFCDPTMIDYIEGDLMEVYYTGAKEKQQTKS
ncbi:MAG: helix-turn-helix transcriptional regulator [Bacteroidota bacterium]